MADVRIRGDELFEMPGGGTIRAAGLEGTVRVEEAGARRRGATSWEAMDAALSTQAVTDLRHIDLALAPRGVRSAGVRLDAPPTVELDVAAPPDGYAQVLLGVDESGACRWHVPVRTRSAGGGLTYHVPVAPVPDEAQRGVITRVIGQVLRVLVFPVTDPLVGAVTEAFAARWEARHRPARLLRLDAARWPDAELEPVDSASLAGGRALLLLHGTFSTTPGSFGNLQASVLRRLAGADGQVLAYDHPTMSVAPDENARDLFRRLGDGGPLALDVVGFSRGGLVARCLDRLLREEGARTRVDRIVLVGTPNEGTALASPDRWDDLLDRTTTLFRVIPAFGAQAALEAVVAAVKVLAHGIRRGLDGIAAMDPEGAWLRDLNADGSADGPVLHAVSANFEPRRSGLWTFLQDAATNTVADGVFGRVGNDLVVPAESVVRAGADPGFPVPAERTLHFDADAGVHHLGYFARGDVRDALEAWMRDETPAAQQAGTRVALVVGNGGYRSGPLANPRNDAADLAALLRELDFEVVEAVDVPTRAALHAEIRDFRSRLVEGGVGLFFFAGHGIQVGGRNYLLPTEAAIHFEDEVTDHAVDMEMPLRAMQAAGCRPSVVVLDCCRDNPFQRRFRSAARGLATLVAPADAFIAYATGPGETARDGDGRNSPFSEALLQHLPAPGVPLEIAMKRVMRTVRQSTSPPQIPWYSSSFDDEFHFRPREEPGGDDAPDTVTESPPATAVTPPRVVSAEVPLEPGGFRVLRPDVAVPEGDPRDRWVCATERHLEARARIVDELWSLALLDGLLDVGSDEIAALMRAGLLAHDRVDLMPGTTEARVSLTSLLVEGKESAFRAGLDLLTDDVGGGAEFTSILEALHVAVVRDEPKRAAERFAAWRAAEDYAFDGDLYLEAGNALLPLLFPAVVLNQPGLAWEILREWEDEPRSVDRMCVCAAGHKLVFHDDEGAERWLVLAADRAVTAFDHCTLAVARRNLCRDEQAALDGLHRAQSAVDRGGALVCAHTWSRLFDDEDERVDVTLRAGEDVEEDWDERLRLARARLELLGDLDGYRERLQELEAQTDDDSRRWLLLGDDWWRLAGDRDRGAACVQRAEACDAG